MSIFPTPEEIARIEHEEGLRRSQLLSRRTEARASVENTISRWHSYAANTDLMLQYPEFKDPSSDLVLSFTNAYLFTTKSVETAYSGGSMFTEQSVSDLEVDALALKIALDRLCQSVFHSSDKSTSMGKRFRSLFRRNTR
jgi:hypothetical protein